MVVHTCNSSTSEAETGGLLQVWGLFGLHSDFKMSQNKTKKQKPETKPNHPASIWACWYEITTNKNALWVFS